jgi:hypothetical protein
MTLAEYNNETQYFRDTMERFWQGNEKDRDRLRDIMVAQMQAKGAKDQAEATLWGNFGLALAKGWSDIKTIFD